MRYSFFILTFLLSFFASAQTNTKIVMHLQSADTLVHRSIVNQISNMKKEMPESEISIVCHGPGMDFLLKNKSKYIEQLHKMQLNNVQVIGCEFTMKQRNIKKDDLVTYALTVPYALTDIVRKQADGWIYVKLGF